MKTSRRYFLKTASCVLASPLIVPQSVLGQVGRPSPNERITLACIGVGGMGTGNLRSFLQDERVQVVAICDVDANHRKRGLGIAKLKESDGSEDFRSIVERKDIDAVMVATPDHWHALITLALAKAGKDIYCEKPLAASIAEGRLVSETVRRENRVLQCGTWRRSGAHVRKACELVRNGYIGDLKRIEVAVPGEFAIRGGYTGLEGPQPVPPELNYSMWLGPAPEAPYTAARCPFNFRWVMDYAPGYITDWGAHFLDVAQWGHGSDHTAPVGVTARNVKKRERGIYDAPEQFLIEYVYADGVEMSMVATSDSKQWGTRFVGSKGWVFTENERLEADPPELLRVRIKDQETRLYVSANHHRNFMDCVRSRKVTAAPAEAAHRAASCCHLGTVAAVLKRELKFDPVAEQFPGDQEANRLLARPMRAPWILPG
jgi:predicted dehydrogenase